MGSPEHVDERIDHAQTLERMSARARAWASKGEGAIGAELTELLVSALSLEHAALVLHGEGEGVRRTERPGPLRHGAAIQRALATAEPFEARSDEHGRHGVRVPLPGVEGRVVVVSRRESFPTAAERALLSAAAAQAALALQIERERAARRALSEDARRKDELFTVLAHELRNPLASVVTAGELLEEELQRGDALSRAAKVVGRQSRQAARLLDGVLDLARMSRGDVSLTLAPLDLREIGRRAVDAQRDGARRGGIRLEVEVAAAPVVVEGDAVRLMQVATNVVSNALKYTPSGGRVEVEVRRVGDGAELEVRDTGVGMAPDELERVFEPFARGSVERGTRAEGLGVGLAVVRDIVRRHGGEVTARSKGVGRGAQVVVRLPIVAAKARRLSSQSMPVVTGRGLRLLIVDPDEDAAEMMALLVGKTGHVSRVARDAATALALVTTFAPDVALVNLGGSGAEGRELGARLRARRPAVGLVGLSGQAGDEARGESVAAGFFRHLVKPVRRAELERALAEWVQLGGGTG